MKKAKFREARLSFPALWKGLDCDDNRIVYIPLDERACNYQFPQQLAQMAGSIRLLTPPESMMGYRKDPADCEWLLENFRTLKLLNPSLTIHPFNIVARVTAYNGSMEDKVG